MNSSILFTSWLAKSIGAIEKRTTGVDNLRLLQKGTKYSVEKRKKHFSEKIDKKRYILFFITDDSDEYLKLMIDVFEKLLKNHKNIVLVLTGKVKKTSILSKLDSHFAQKKILILERTEQKDLSVLFKTAYLCTIFPSSEKEFELFNKSLSNNCITITERNQDTFRLAEHSADYIIYNSFNELYETIDTYLNYPALYCEKKKYIFDNSTKDKVFEIKKDNGSKKIQTPEKLQFVFISIDFDKLKKTIKLIDNYIDFVDSYIIVTSKDMYEDFKGIRSDRKIFLINENNILSENIDIPFATSNKKLDFEGIVT